MSTAVLASGVLALAGCRDTADTEATNGAANGADVNAATASADNAPTTARARGDDTVEPFVMKGTVTTTAGEPIEGAKVHARNTLVSYSNLRAVTDAQGRYRIELPRHEVTTWQAGGTVERTYHGGYYELRLGDVGSPFGSSEGAVRNMVMHLTGISDPKYDIYVGEMIDFDLILPGVDWSDDEVELTLVPDGPLIDGSAGETLVKRFDGHLLKDVPIGRYAFSARWMADSGPVDLLLRVGYKGAWQPSVTAVIPGAGKDKLRLQGTTAEGAASIE
ncbi:carboxypeptidase regulatory-like domain-containing protein [Luteimonas sp. e5]